METPSKAGTPPRVLNFEDLEDSKGREEPQDPVRPYPTVAASTRGTLRRVSKRLPRLSLACPYAGAPPEHVRGVLRADGGVRKW